MLALIHPRRLALIIAVLAGSLAGTFATASPNPPIAEGVSSARECSFFCPKRLWLRAPVIRSHAR